MKVIDNREARVVFAEDLKLLPGKNALDPAAPDGPQKIALWEHAKKNDVVRHMLREKKLVEQNVDVGDEAQALELVAGENDPDVLEAMQLTEARPAVLKAIAEKLEKLGPTPEQKKALEDAERKNAANRKEAERARAGARGKPSNVTEE